MRLCSRPAGRVASVSEWCRTAGARTEQNRRGRVPVVWVHKRRVGGDTHTGTAQTQCGTRDSGTVPLHASLLIRRASAGLSTAPPMCRALSPGRCCGHRPYVAVGRARGKEKRTAATAMPRPSGAGVTRRRVDFAVSFRVLEQWRTARPQCKPQLKRLLCSCTCCCTTTTIFVLFCFVFYLTNLGTGFLLCFSLGLDAARATT
jgi:hypothetical protein